MTVARDYLGMKVEEREVLFSEVAFAGVRPVRHCRRDITCRRDMRSRPSYQLPERHGKTGPVCQKLW